MTVREGRLCKSASPYLKYEDDMAPPSDNLNVAKKRKDPYYFPILYAGEGKEWVWNLPLALLPKTSSNASSPAVTKGTRRSLRSRMGSK
jgi:hypothetical protein